MTFFKSLLVLLSIVIFTACNKNSSTTLSPTVVDSLKTVFTDINGQLEVAWEDMIKDDDEKLDNLRRILQEVEYSGDYNRLKLDSLKEHIDELQQVRYDQNTMADSDLINFYDSLTTQVMGEVTIFTTRLEQFEQYPTMGQLLQEVFEADDRVLKYRIEYDKSAKEYNAFIEANQDHMQLVARQRDLKSKPLFELQN
jgi:hypothetical protein